MQYFVQNFHLLSVSIFSKNINITLNIMHFYYSIVHYFQCHTKQEREQIPTQLSKQSIDIKAREGRSQSWL